MSGERTALALVEPPSAALVKEAFGWRSLCFPLGCDRHPVSCVAGIAIPAGAGQAPARSRGRAPWDAEPEVAVPRHACPRPERGLGPVARVWIGCAATCSCRRGLAMRGRRASLLPAATSVSGLAKGAQTASAAGATSQRGLAPLD